MTCPGLINRGERILQVINVWESEAEEDKLQHLLSFKPEKGKKFDKNYYSSPKNAERKKEKYRNAGAPQPSYAVCL